MLTCLRSSSRSFGIALLSLNLALAGLPRPAVAADSPFQIVEVTDFQAADRDRAPRRASTGRPAARRAISTNPRRAASPGPETNALDQEPNEDAATATPLTGTKVVVRANIYPSNDVDFYSFSAIAGDRVYAAVQTLFDAQINSGDTVLDLIGADGATVIESDDNDGTFNASSSSVAGMLMPATGTFFLRVRHNVGDGSPSAPTICTSTSCPVRRRRKSSRTTTRPPPPPAGLRLGQRHDHGGLPGSSTSTA